MDAARRQTLRRAALVVAPLLLVLAYWARPRLVAATFMDPQVVGGLLLVGLAVALVGAWALLRPARGLAVAAVLVPALALPLALADLTTWDLEAVGRGIPVSGEATLLSVQAYAYIFPTDVYSGHVRYALPAGSDPEDVARRHGALAAGAGWEVDGPRLTEEGAWVYGGWRGGFRMDASVQRAEDAPHPGVAPDQVILDIALQPPSRF